ncbi:transposase [Streptomyces sp. NPDC055722]
MLPPSTVPVSLIDVLQIVRSCFTAPSFATLCSLVTGVLAADGPRTVTGMWSAAGLAGRCHWSRGHRFFSRAVWDLDAVGLALARTVTAAFVPEGGAVTVAVDDSLFHRFGKKVHGAAWQHDGSAHGRDGTGRGNCFVIAGIVVRLPFLARQICLPVLFRLHIPKTDDSKTEEARKLAGLIAAALPERKVHVVGDALYRGPAWRDLPDNLTFTTRLAANAVLYGPEPPRTRKRGRPRWKRRPPGHPRRDRRYRDLADHHHRDLRRDQSRADLRPAMPVVGQPAPHPRQGRPAALRRLDPRGKLGAGEHRHHRNRGGDHHPVRGPLVHRAGDQGREELFGVGDPRSRTRNAVQRTVPFQLACQTVLVLWYACAGNANSDVHARREAAPRYRHKQHVSLEDMIIAFRRARITVITAGHPDPMQIQDTRPTSTPTAA